MTRVIATICWYASILAGYLLIAQWIAGVPLADFTTSDKGLTVFVGLIAMGLAFGASEAEGLRRRTLDSVGIR